MTQFTRLPTPDDGLDGLLQLADDAGTREAFELLRWVRTIPNSDVSDALAILAARMLSEEMRTEQKFDKARQDLAGSLGYNDKTRTNFYKMLSAGRRLIQQAEN